MRLFDDLYSKKSMDTTSFGCVKLCISGLFLAQPFRLAKKEQCMTFCMDFMLCYLVGHSQGNIEFNLTSFVFKNCFQIIWIMLHQQSYFLLAIYRINLAIWWYQVWFNHSSLIHGVFCNNWNLYQNWCVLFSYCRNIHR